MLIKLICSVVIMACFIISGCAARQQAIYKIEVERHIKRNFDSTACKDGQRHMYRVKVDVAWYIISAQAEKNTPLDQCSKDFEKAIQVSSPLPPAPHSLQQEALSEGFIIAF